MTELRWYDLIDLLVRCGRQKPRTALPRVLLSHARDAAHVFDPSGPMYDAQYVHTLCVCVCVHQASTCACKCTTHKGACCTPYYIILWVARKRPRHVLRCRGLDRHRRHGRWLICPTVRQVQTLDATKWLASHSMTIVRTYIPLIITRVTRRFWYPIHQLCSVVQPPCARTCSTAYTMYECVSACTHACVCDNT